MTSTDRPCTCRERLVDWVRLTVTHPYLACPRYGATDPYEGPRMPEAKAS